MQTPESSYDYSAADVQKAAKRILDKYIYRSKILNRYSYFKKNMPEEVRDIYKRVLNCIDFDHSNFIDPEDEVREYTYEDLAKEKIVDYEREFIRGLEILVNLKGVLSPDEIIDHIHRTIEESEYRNFQFIKSLREKERDSVCGYIFSLKYKIRYFTITRMMEVFDGECGQKGIDSKRKSLLKKCEPETIVYDPETGLPVMDTEFENCRSGGNWTIEGSIKFG